MPACLFLRQTLLSYVVFVLFFLSSRSRSRTHKHQTSNILASRLLSARFLSLSLLSSSSSHSFLFHLTGTSFTLCLHLVVQAKQDDTVNMNFFIVTSFLLACLVTAQDNGQGYTTLFLPNGTLVAGDYVASVINAVSIYFHSLVDNLFSNYMTGARHNDLLYWMSPRCR